MSVGLTSENKVQTALIADINNAGGYAYKASNMYTTGVPDLAITPPFSGLPVGYPMHIKMEVKFEKVTRRTRGVTVGLSTPQFQHLKKTHDANGIACWVAAYTFTDCRRWGLYMLHHTFGKSFKMCPNDIDEDDFGHFAKELGKPWRVRDLCNLIVNSYLHDDYSMYSNYRDNA